MAKKNSISQLFTEQFEELRDKRMEELERDSKKKVLTSLIDAYRNYFPLWVVLAGLPANPRLEIMHCVGKIDWGDRSETELFYERSVSNFLGFDMGTIYKRITPLGAVVPGVEEPCVLSDNEIKDVLKRLEEVVAAGKMTNEIVAPSGFYVFQFTAQWAVGGYEEDPNTRMMVFKADSLKDALDEFERHFRFPASWNENCFRDFKVYHDNMWQWIKANSIVPPFHFSVS